MRVIKYYDRIYTNWIDLEVTDEVAKFLMRNDKWMRRKQNQYNYYNNSIDTPLYHSDEDDEDITFVDTVAEVVESEEEIEYYDKRRKKLIEIVRKVVSKLDDKQQTLIHELFTKEGKQTVIAKKVNTTTSNITQLKQTAFLHLRYHFYTDEDFKKTDIYKRNKIEFDFDLIKVTKEIDNEKGLTFNLNNIRDLTKDNTQMLKSLSNLGIKLDDKQKELFTYMNRVVKQTLDKLDVDWSKTNTINIPQNLEIPKELNPQKIR